MAVDVKSHIGPFSLYGLALVMSNRLGGLVGLSVKSVYSRWPGQCGAVLSLTPMIFDVLMC